MRLAILYINYGPYHLARIESCFLLFKEKGWDVVGIEFARQDNVYAWKTDIQELQIPIISIFGERYDRNLSLLQIYQRTAAVLHQIQPDVIAIAGYAEKVMLSSLLWCQLHRKAAILISDSKEDDAPRRWWMEKLKSLLVNSYQSALVAGKPHHRYLTQLGMSSNAIFFPCDVVGNKEFHPDRIRKLPKPIERPYFLAVNRFVPNKNISFLISAYTRYRHVQENNAWDLVICGDGELRSQIEQQIRKNNLQGSVHLPGFLQQQQLLPYFSHASCFIHSSTQEQWGLVVNEAMAAGLPVLVSNRCGCYEDLIVEGVNGFSFDPENLEQLVEMMNKISSGDVDLYQMGKASLAHIKNFSPDNFAQGLMSAAQYALAQV